MSYRWNIVLQKVQDKLTLNSQRESYLMSIL